MTDRPPREATFKQDFLNALGPSARIPDRLPPPCPVCGRTLEHIIGCPEMDRPR